MGLRIGVGGLGLIPALEIIKTDHVAIVAADTLRFGSSDVICTGELKKSTTICCLILVEEIGGLLRILDDRHERKNDLP